MSIKCYFFIPFEIVANAPLHAGLLFSCIYSIISLYALIEAELTDLSDAHGCIKEVLQSLLSIY
jgi:hypothetical protein